MSDAFIEGLGVTLSKAREGLGLSQAEAAQRLKLSVRQIEAIEREDWASLPGEVFLRGFVRNYARTLELNPMDLIRPVSSDAATRTITAPSEGLTIGRSPLTRLLALPLLALLLFLLIVAGLYQWLSQGEQTLVSQPPASQSPPSSSETAQVPAVSDGAPGTVVQPLALDPQALETAPGEAGPPEAAPAAEVPPAPVQEPVKPQTEATDTSSAVQEGTATIRFLPGEDAWIQVVDGQGQRFSKLVRAGVGEQLTGRPPFKLVVGNAASVKLTYNGHQIDLSPFIGEKVARLTLE